MTNTYNIGNTTNLVTLEADITTVGLAASRASILVVSGTDPGIVVAHSVNATGDISTQPIGDRTLLRGKRLTVYTKISLTGNDAAARANEASAVMGTYLLSGGDEGVKSYHNPTNTYIDPNVFLLFTVDLS